MTCTELKEARKHLGLTQKQMAEKLNTPYRTYQDWELGNRRVNGVPGPVEIVIMGMLKKLV